MESDVQIAYSLSSDGRLVHDGIRSIRSLLHYVSPEQITVFYTPPRQDGHVEAFRNLGVDLRLEENETEGFSVMPSAIGERHSKRQYAEKIKLTKLDADTVVFLDCDTFVAGNIFDVISGDFDFKARPDVLGVDDSEWPRLFERYDRTFVDWMPNAGFLVFKNGAHKEIAEDWRRFLEDDIDYTRRGMFLKEQTALALAVSEMRLTKMRPIEHIMEWTGEVASKGIVYHHSPPKVVARIY